MFLKLNYHSNTAWSVQLSTRSSGETHNATMTRRHRQFPVVGTEDARYAEDVQTLWACARLSDAQDPQQTPQTSQCLRNSLRQMFPLLDHLEERAPDSSTFCQLVLLSLPSNMDLELAPHWPPVKCPVTAPPLPKAHFGASPLFHT